MPEINVSPNEARLLQPLAEIEGGRRVLEIGTLVGYSTINVACVLSEDGALISLELDERHASVTRENFEWQGSKPSRGASWGCEGVARPDRR